MGVTIWGWIACSIQALLSGGVLAASFVFFEASSDSVHIPGAAWIFPPLVACLTFGICFRRERNSQSQLKVVERDVATLKGIALAVGGVDWQSLIESGLESLVRHFSDGRANVMLINTDAKPEVLQIEYHYGMEGAPDLDLTWEKREGSCGKAWASSKQAKADLGKADENILQERWQMKPQKIACTKNVGSILSIPLRDIKNRDRIVGVLNCDSTLPLAESGLDDASFLEKAEQHAEVISRFLYGMRVLKGE